MKKLIIDALLVCVITVITAAAFCGCAKSDKPANDARDSGKISVVATIFPPYDFARAIAGGEAEVAMLLPPASESHSFEPTPQDIIKIRDCDVFIYVGGDSDTWVSGVLDSMDTSGMKIVTLMDCVALAEEEIIPGMEDDDEDEAPSGAEPGDPEYDEHVWTSPRNAELIVQKIADALCEIDAVHAETYNANAASYIAELGELDAKFKNVVDNSMRNTIVFGDRFPFRYFADAYGLTYYAAFPGCSTETEASAKTVAFLIDKIKDEDIPVVFHIELGNENMANSIAEQTGAKVMLLHSCHNISKSDFEAGVTYLDIMNANVDALREALN